MKEKKSFTGIMLTIAATISCVAVYGAVPSGAFSMKSLKNDWQTQDMVRHSFFSASRCRMWAASCSRISFMLFLSAQSDCYLADSRGRAGLRMESP